MLDNLLHWMRAVADRWGNAPELLENIALFLVNAYVPIMGGLLTLTAAALLLALRPLSQRLGAVSLRAWIAVFILFDAALALRLFWAPHLPQVYQDELSFLNTADNMARYGLNALSTVDAPPGAHFHQCPAGWQFLISLCYRAFGIHAEVAFTLASVLSAASVPLIFLVVFEMSGRARAGLWGALFLAVLPVHLRLAGCSALETPSLFFLLATLYAIHVFSATGDRSVLLLLACLAAWFTNIRMENSFALAPLLLLYFVLLCPRGVFRTWRERLGLVACLGVAAAFSLPALLADYYGVATKFYFFYQAPETTHAHIMSNLRGNIPYWFDNELHPAAFTLLAVIGVAATFRKRATWFWVLWTVGLVAFYTANPSCDFALRHTLDSWRTALHPALGILVLAALGADALTALLSDMRVIAAVAVALAACAVPWLFRAFIQDRHVWMVQWEAQCRMRSELPPDTFMVMNGTGTAHASSLAYELALTTGFIPHFFALPTDADVSANGKAPQIVHDVQAWKVEKRKVFLYHLDAGRVQDLRDLEQMQSLLSLRPVAGTSLRRIRSSYSLWRIEGSGDAASTAVALPAGKARP